MNWKCCKKMKLLNVAKRWNWLKDFTLSLFCLKWKKKNVWEIIEKDEFKEIMLQKDEFRLELVKIKFQNYNWSNHDCCKKMKSMDNLNDERPILWILKLPLVINDVQSNLFDNFIFPCFTKNFLKSFMANWKLSLMTSTKKWKNWRIRSSAFH